VMLERCEWSGGNGAADRKDGAAKLAACLRGNGQKPQEHRFIVAHSHGGNVALYALRDPEVERLVDGVVCMATPFIVARRRDLGSKGAANILAVLVFAALAFWFFILNGLLEAYVGEVGAFVAWFFYLTFVGGALFSLY
jgi:alpha-beta hydrolase superfamily lysophospholipase